MEIINNLLETINKIVPDKNEAQRLEVEIRKAELDLEREIEKNFKVKSDSKIMKYTFPMLVWAMTLQMLWNAAAPVIWTLFQIEKELPIVHVDEFHAYIIITYCGFFFGGSTIKKSKDAWSHLFRK